MQLNPRYGTDPILTLDGAADAIATPAIRQRARMVETLADFGPEQWANASRCDAWSSRDVLVHLETTNFFWETSIRSGLEGLPTQFLSTFDPAKSPAEHVAASDASAAEVFEKYAASSASLNTFLGTLSAIDWEATAEAPPGHISASAVAHHALWDSWIHERDILVPLGMQPDEEADEIIAALRYAAALTPAAALINGSTGSAVFGVSVTEPDTAFHVVVDDHVALRSGVSAGAFSFEGSAVALLEGLSFRAPLDHDVPSSLAWVFAGLGELFDTPG